MIHDTSVLTLPFNMNPHTLKLALFSAARDAGKTLVELSFQWLLAQPQVDSIILGASQSQQLAENLKACEEGTLDQAALDR